MTAVGILSVVGVAATTSGAVGSVRAAGTWKAGDCFKSGDPSTTGIDLSSKVACSKKHAFQVLSGTALPASLASASYATFASSTSSTARAGLAALGNLNCLSPNVAASVYPKHASVLAPLFLKYQVTVFFPPGPGALAWSLPDEASFAAGVKDVLCVFEVDEFFYGKVAGDVRQVGTSATLPNFRRCNNYDKAGDIVWVSCAKAHEQETLILVTLSVTGQPAAVKDWTDASWDRYDAACAEFAKVLVGAERTEFKIISDTDPGTPVLDFRRLFSCKTAARKGNFFPSGSLVDLGTKKIKIQKAKGKP